MEVGQAEVRERRSQDSMFPIRFLKTVIFRLRRGWLIKTLFQYSSLYFSFLNGPKNGGLELPLPDTTGQKTILVLGKLTELPMENIM